MNCKYCGLWNCKNDNPICDEQKNGQYADHPARAFKIGDWVNHVDLGFGQVAWVLPKEKGIRVSFNDNKTSTDWFDPEKLTRITDSHPAIDANGKAMQVGDHILYPLSKGGAGNGACIKYGVVQKIEESPSHRGYGYWTRKIKIKDDESEKVFSHNYPANCIVVTEKGMAQP